MVTVFTPTYNRAYCLSQLYESLCSQTSSNFEWVIVDDCSSDNTKFLVEDWLEEKKIPVVYFLQSQNGGKHRAINKGVELAKGELFFIVDSDDFLTADAIESIETEWDILQNKKKYAGICFRRMTKKFDILGDDFPEYRCSGTSVDIAYKWNCAGDKAEVFKTEVLRKYPFPNIKGEMFCQEAVIWFKIAMHRNALLLCVNKGIYVCEYLPDGLTANYEKVMSNNPRYALLWELTLLRIPYEWKWPEVKYRIRGVLSLIYRIYFKRFFKRDS